MECNTISFKEPAHKTPRKRSLIPKALGNTIPRSASLLSALISRRPSIRRGNNRKRESMSTPASGQQEGTFTLLTRPTHMSPIPSRHQSVEIPHRHLMKPMYPPIPKSRTLGSLETNLLYLTPETSPTRSKRSSQSSSTRSSRAFPGPTIVQAHPTRRSHTFGHSEDIRNLLPTYSHESYSPPSTFTRMPQWSPTPRTRHQAPSGLRSDNSSTSTSNHSYRNVSLRGLQNTSSSNTAARRATLTPSQIPRPGSVRNSTASGRRPSLPTVNTPAVPPLPAFAHTLGNLNTPRSAPLAPHRPNEHQAIFQSEQKADVPGQGKSAGGRKSSIPYPAITPSGRRSRIPTPSYSYNASNSGGRKSSLPYRSLTHGRAKCSSAKPAQSQNKSYGRKTSLPSSNNTPPSIKSRVPTPAHPGRQASNFSILSTGSYHDADPALYRQVSRHGNMPGQNRLLSGQLSGQITGQQSRHPSIEQTWPATPEAPCTAIKDAASPSFEAHHDMESPTPKAARTYRAFGSAQLPKLAQPEPSDDDAPTSQGLLESPDPALQVLGIQPPEYWLGRYISVSDRVRTEEIEVKAAMVRGDPSARNHPANTGMLDDEARKMHVMNYLTQCCGDELAIASLQSFKAEFEARERRGGRGPGRAAPNNGEGNADKVEGKINVFERLRRRSKSKG